MGATPRSVLLVPMSTAIPTTTMAYGAPTMAPQQMYLDEKTITQQKTDAVTALANQDSEQANMLKHQYDAQVAQLEAECTRNTQMATAQFQQSFMQSKMQLEMQYKEQTMELDSAKMQREMAISQQAAQMTAQAQQMSLQQEMQKKMMSLYTAQTK